MFIPNYNLSLSDSNSGSILIKSRKSPTKKQLFEFELNYKQKLPFACERMNFYEAIDFVTRNLLFIEKFNLCSFIMEFHDIINWNLMDSTTFKFVLNEIEKVPHDKIYITWRGNKYEIRNNI